VSNDASILYSKNVMALLNLMIKDGEIDLNMEDEIIKKTLLTHQGEITHEPTASSLKEGIEL
jgi:NAD(P) transhydrogenase subunit alpha